MRKRTPAYRVVSDWAGVPWSRASSLYRSFEEADREAQRVARKGRRARVYEITGGFMGKLMSEHGSK